jgi:diaminohydroxyphosphoribosylaminopyrimidine deaminase/5-amino-6-(5-phosphoribosylamino)uracil reductase
MTPEAAMRLALAQARGALGRVFPNPAVGAVVYRGDRVLGRGRTRPVGGAHAEIVAIDHAVARHGARALRGASMASTLEPCCHVGRTGPCAERIIAAGIGRVQVGIRDPHPAVAGGGLRKLRRAGIEVQTGVLEAACHEQHRGFLSLIERGRPFVVLKLAATLDGRIATRAGESRWITGPKAREAVHRMRARSDAILVGIGTALADDPTLTARRGRRVVHRPVRVIADSRLRLPPDARVVRGATPTYVLCASSAGASRRRALERAGAILVDVRRRGTRLDLARGLERLGGFGITELLVEGGGQLAASLLQQGLVDELHWFVAPRLIGGDGRAALGPLGLQHLAGACSIENLRVRRVGPDLHLSGRVRDGDPAS